MLYGKYLFSSVFEDNAILPPYKGSSFRGVFGIALKKVVCALRKQDCKDCLLREKCVYSFVFETPAARDEPGDRKRVASPPHPYVIEPSDTKRISFKEGEPFDFFLLLFGKANDYLPYFIYAFEQMGKLGIGKKIDGKRARFLLKKVICNGKLAYSGETGKITTDKCTEELQIENFMPDDLANVHRIDISLKTPLRLKFQNRLEADLPFHILTRAMLRRVYSLQNYYGSGEPSLDYRGIVDRAKTVETVNSSLRWFDWERYSNKQDQSMLMGGIVGEVSYSGDLTEFMPFVRFCEKVHIGKQTSFGLGKIEITGIY
ncbi:MAG: CRISPR system precrRNA processing endoribonuclease RAMP protein Cas6 [Thermodesulfobacteriota bacterium]